MQFGINSFVMYNYLMIISQVLHFAVKNMKNLFSNLRLFQGINFSFVKIYANQIKGITVVFIFIKYSHGTNSYLVKFLSQRKTFFNLKPNI